MRLTVGDGPMDAGWRMTGSVETRNWEAMRLMHALQVGAAGLSCTEENAHGVLPLSKQTRKQGDRRQGDGNLHGVLPLEDCTHFEASCHPPLGYRCGSYRWSFGGVRGILLALACNEGRACTSTS